MVGDFLKKFRSNGYSKPGPESDNGEGEDKPETEHSRIISLTDDEKQVFKDSKPGEELACEVHGQLEADGHFHVMSVQPLDKQAGYGSEEEMAGAVAQRVTPSVQLSPS